MKPSQAILGKQEEIKRIVESYGFIQTRIFGSTARKSDKDGSDLDIVARIPNGMKGSISLFEIMDMESKLEKLTGVTVDFNVDNNIPIDIKKEVDEDSLSL